MAWDALDVHVVVRPVVLGVADWGLVAMGVPVGPVEVVCSLMVALMVASFCICGGSRVMNGRLVGGIVLRLVQCWWD